MDEREQRAWQKVVQYQAYTYYLRGILNLITEAMMVYSGQELKERITELIKDGKEHTHLAP